MKFKFKTSAERKAKYTEWHEWFAWFPVTVAQGEVVWLSKVLRRGTIIYGDMYWDYKVTRVIP